MVPLFSFQGNVEHVSYEAQQCELNVSSLQPREGLVAAACIKDTKAKKDKTTPFPT